MSQFEIHAFICRKDNIGVLIHDPVTRQTASVDTPDAQTIREVLTDRGWHLTHIFNTHHCHDHIAGNLNLKQQYHCRIIGNGRDTRGIPGMDIAVREGDRYEFGGQFVQFLETPGHTLTDLTIWFETAAVVFTGDSLFSLGCGRLHEGTPEMMHNSLQKIKRLPDDTQLYCGHEYTLANGEFALSVEPDNQALQHRIVEARTLRERGALTLPVTLGTEKATNPFLRTDSREIRAVLKMENAEDVRVFAALRKKKDSF